MQCSVLVHEDPVTEELEYYSFLWAFKSPFQLALMRLRRRMRVWTTAEGEAMSMLELGQRHMEFDFDVIRAYLFSFEDGVT